MPNPKRYAFKRSMTTGHYEPVGDIDSPVLPANDPDNPLVYSDIRIDFDADEQAYIISHFFYSSRQNRLAYFGNSDTVLPKIFKLCKEKWHGHIVWIEPKTAADLQVTSLRLVKGQVHDIALIIPSTINFWSLNTLLESAYKKARDLTGK
jgi:hypothetical protein